MSDAIDRRSFIGAAGALAASIAADARVLPAGRASLARVIIDNDFAGDPDGLVALAHQLLNARTRVTLITSSAHFRTLTSSSTFTVVDFYADWCGPCKVISPVFEQLASAESKPGKIIFCKVDVDAQREIAGNYGVSA